MPGPVSDTHTGTPDGAPYVPSWCYSNGPKECPCGHHEGYHADDGACLHEATCGCTGLPPECLTPLSGCTGDDLEKQNSRPVLAGESE